MKKQNKFSNSTSILTLISTLILTLVLSSTSLFSQIPTGYYDGTDGLNGDNLKAVLHGIIDNHTELSYNALRDYVLEDTDRDPDTSANVILIYTGRSQNANDTWDAGDDGWNREHIWSKSHGGFGNNPPAGTDAHHIRPCDVSVNSAKSNRDFDWGDTPHSEATECSTATDIWEPRDAVKGDVARMIFYMEVRYEGENGEPDLEMVDYVDTAPSGQPYYGKLSTLLEWNRQDTVDAFERNRNEVIYGYQNNRNPFIDHPEFADSIWNVADTIPPVITDIEVLTDSTNATITWETVEDSDSKVHYGSIISNLQYSVVKGTFESSHSITINGLTSETKYYFQVSSTDDDGNGPSISPVDSFITYKNLTTLVSDASFETGLDGWTTYSVASDENWERTDSDYYTNPSPAQDGSYYMYINNYNGSSAGDDWLISPEIDASVYDSLWFTFYSWTKYTDTNYPRLKIKISTNYSGSGDPGPATWNVISSTLSPANSETWTYSDKVNLSDENSSLHIAFQYTSSGTSASNTTAWAIDQFELWQTTATSIIAENIPKTFKLGSPYPNPFNPNFTIPLQLDKNSFVNIQLVNILGQKVMQIKNAEMNLGEYNLNVNCSNLTSGVYFVKVSVDNQNDVRKVVLLK